MISVAVRPLRAARAPINGLPRIARRCLASIHDDTDAAAAAATKPAIPAPAAGKPLKKSSSKLVFDNRKTLHDFLRQSAPPIDPALTTIDRVPYLGKPDGRASKFYVEVYGCQMNTNDTEILNAILHQSGFQRTTALDDADIVFLMTCAIRDGAEQKIWARLDQLKAMRTKQGLSLKVGVLGCMAERLRDKLLDQDKLVDVVCGPDAYRSLPYLLALADENHQVANVMLSADETYADIMPLRLDPSQISAHLSIMRGCNNMCAFCIVPFTRGTERSRPIQSIVDEVRKLSEQGIREVTLLGQNVNSYRDTTATDALGLGADLAPGFSTIYKRKDGGLRFAELIDRVAAVDPELRIRFTSPHPKDFPDDLLHVIRAHPNICNQLHLPAQSGSTTMLQRMRRGYSRDAFLSLVDRARELIPNVALSTDIIAGFCGETEAEHQDTVSLMREVAFDQAFMFAYSMREKTYAHRHLEDNVPADVKSRRLAEIIATHYDAAKSKHQRLFVGTRQLVLVDGKARRNTKDGREQYAGRAESNLKVHFTLPDDVVGESLVGKYVAVEVHTASGASLSGEFRAVSSIREFYVVSEPRAAAPTASAAAVALAGAFPTVKKVAGATASSVSS
ncbi:tRNA-I(6)A37 thiotransferase enzyme MiaB [Allomyces macrogynus ATCC 38327]|uniref:tRNA-I(6)A37 thiotransferase enzyme MiaB n=1 Tax=Allomyces macrogynus (strain ATCC 38327) TaxID=578462 RepID=A0A0L0TCP0_ALLM3|nr:tRNA-I(6)A37 thiotransferase enzyme MiaB [Allomyces macrogynus ATCC 38327]|eukprot:KNE72309.1 tRNA-I(6)A37 thiotransferase enzyme MiaB [Allomyces macrogynus ATCC 38327]